MRGTCNEKKILGNSDDDFLDNTSYEIYTNTGITLFEYIFLLKIYSL